MTHTTTFQTPLHSGFCARTTATEALAGRDLSGVLAGAGARVLVPARDPHQAQAALAGMAGVEVAALDLLDPQSIDAFAAAFLGTGRALHVLLNGAGIMATPLLRDARGYEAQFATNHLGHFQLTARLWPALRQARGARVVCVSSLGHRQAGVDLDDPHFLRQPYDKWRAYAQSKSANALFAVELDRRGAAHGVRAFSLHPGAILTPLVRHLDQDDLRRVGALDDDGQVNPPPQSGFKNVAQGAATAVWCATSAQLEGMGGVYCEDGDIAAVVADDSTGPGVRRWAIDPTQARQLWALSEQMTGVCFDGDAA
ncbi:SDR family NAD(P)-dependent oxidoreductase [Janthinobacterium sp. NKUCC06_STL]|uniref:SDR family NAD(P)-dependent oxidoreductase n=1 Tax=Janthinobacterium sp. NKUCC06_STL TaxID=2842127 RepID=UPI001C5B6282|nr:SDR family NAD(P)-dependent oxidoreductase [Janthinobacterium sp. NKUCC06_STL]MBW3509007.1 SDR family NAD(P)-dependent oxidoreductase [Janthinobacterium sp. NKUCC06_STL]